MRRAPLYIRLAAFVLGAALVAAPVPVLAFSRVKDLVEVEGIRDNMLVGYGLVVGLNGTGDSLKNAPFTQQSIQTMLERLGVNTRGQIMQTKNVAAVMVTANLPAFAAPGTRIDVSCQRHGRRQESAGRHLAGHAAVRRRRPDLCASARAPSRSAASPPRARPPASRAACPRRGASPTAPLWNKETGFQLASMDQSETVAAQSRPHHRHPHRQAVNAYLGGNVAERDRSLQCASCTCPPTIPAA